MAKNKGTNKAFRKLEQKSKKEAKEKKEKERKEKFLAAKQLEEKKQEKKKLTKRLVLAAASLMVLCIVGSVVFVHAESIGESCSKIWKSISGPSAKKGKVNCSYLQNQDLPQCQKHKKTKKKKGASFSFAP